MSAPDTVRVYGPSSGYGSFQRIAAGAFGALEDLGRADGFWSHDHPDRAVGRGPEAAGSEATIALHFGAPSRVVDMRSHGRHERRYCVVAPNSTWMPLQLFEQVAEHAKLVVPSSWAATVVEEAVGLRPPVYQHGASVEFFRAPRPRDADLPFTAVHFASTAGERKSTGELLAAWQKLAGQGALGKRCRLDIVSSAGFPHLVQLQAKADAMQGGSAPSDRTVLVRPRSNLSPDKMRAALHAYSLVAQPSRGEGFGLVPLESLCCGVPVLATTCTGHSEYLFTRGELRAATPGLFPVATGDLEPIDDGPGALAPSLSAESVQEALLGAYARRRELAVEAHENAPSMCSRWSWRAVTERWLSQDP